MGVMRFLVHPAELLNDWPEVHRAYISGPDQSVWPTRIEIEGNQVICRRASSDSGKLHVAWPVSTAGRPVLSTASLHEREEPYLLAVELARGKLVQVRNQLALWQGAGMSVPREFSSLHSAAHRLFAKAAASQDAPESASQLAQQALAQECEAAELLTRVYTKQRLDNRHRQYPHLPTALGCSLGDGMPSDKWKPDFVGAFNSAGVPLEWRVIEPEEGDYHWETYDAQVDWCTSHGLMMRGGPLIDLSPDGMPNWLWQWERDYWNLQSFICDFIETAISRYLGRIRIWEIAARINTGGALTLTEEHRLTIVAKALEVARQVDQEGQFLVRIDQPWGEYQARGQHKLSPMHFADALVRAGLGLSAINLEIGVGYAPRGTASRDLLDFSRMIDYWSAIGVPLQVTLAFPSARSPDPNLNRDMEVEGPSWKLPWTEEAQADWIDLHLPLLMAKPAVVGIFWTHFSDSEPHRFPHAGLLRPDGTPKPALSRIVRQKKAYW